MSARSLRAVLAGMVQARLAALDLAPSHLRILGSCDPRTCVDLELPEPHAASGLPALLGRTRQLGLPRGHRHRNGVYYTPEGVVNRLSELALDGIGDRVPGGTPLRICDPAMGVGAFLLGVAERLVGLGYRPSEVVERCLWGADIDELAVAVAEAALYIWAAEQGDPPAGGNLAVADSLLDGPRAWGSEGAGFDAVVGNPPFQNQLQSSTARQQPERLALRARLGPVARAYTDAATLFLVQAVQMAAEGGRVVLVMPQSFLTARDAGAARRQILEEAELVGLWHCNEPLFQAQVRVCAPVLKVRSNRPRGQQPTLFDAGSVPQGSSAHARTAVALPEGQLCRFSGPNVEPAPPRPWRTGEPGSLPTWSPLVSDLLGVPGVILESDRTIGDHARATAGFRDQYYGISSHVEEESALVASEADPICKLVTAGAIEPGRVLWGSRPTRFAGARWERPVVHLAGLDPRLRRWATDLLVPKVVLPTQTRVLEPAVDELGDWYPSVPVIAVIPDDPAILWHIFAALLAPPVSAWAWANHAGGSLSASTLKLAAREVLRLPVPPEGPLWDRGARLARAVHAAQDAQDWRSALEAVGQAMCDAYGVAREPILQWWLGRLPLWRDR